jgi:hypothetical protein
MKNQATPRYLEDVLKELDAKPPKSGSVTIVKVVHGDHCALLAGRGPCDCRLIVMLGQPDPRGGSNL